MESSRYSAIDIRGNIYDSALFMAAEFSLYRCLFKVLFSLEIPVMPSPV